MVRRFPSVVGAAALSLGAWGLASCAAPKTVLHMVAAGDSARSSSEAPARWTEAGFTDSAWSAAATPLSVEKPGVVRLRERFDIGPDAAAFTSLQLAVDGATSWRAWINGAPAGSSDGARGSTLTVPAGTLLATGNVLAIEAHARPGASVTPTLGGLPARRAPLHVSLGPWLQRPRPDGVTVVFETSQPAPARVLVEGRAFDAGSGRHHVAEVRGLDAGRAYTYHVDVAGWLDTEASFTTPPPAGASGGDHVVTFAVWGDHRTGGDEHRRGALSVLADAPDFLVDTGDLVARSAEPEWRAFFSAEYELLRRVPLYPSLGNHEALTGGRSRFTELFPVAAAEDDGKRGREKDSYSFDVGSVHVAVLDSNGDMRRQAKWLDADLAQATARGQSALFVAAHWGLASSGRDFMHGINPSLRRWVAPVAKAHDVVAILGGHDHFYERGHLDGVRYVVTGGGGAPIQHNVKKLPGTEVLALAQHHCLVTVNGPAVTLKAVALDGSIIDDVRLR